MTGCCFTNRMFPRRGVFLLLALCCLASACESRTRPGEVARINGRVITLPQLEAMQSSAFPDWPATSAVDQEALRRQYNPALMNLLALELVKQQLEKKKLSVTDAQVLAEEDNIRADYPPGAFEALLVNEGIDRESWRFLLRNKLSLQHFLEKILRPGITIASDEATEYYRSHEAEFVRPPWAHFILVSGLRKAQVERGRRRLAETNDPALVQAEFPDLAVRSVRMDKKRLFPEFVAELARLQPGQISPAVRADKEFHALMLIEATEERRLSPTEAYPLIEKTLLEEKLHAAYNAWLQGRFAKADVRVSRHLLPSFAVRSPEAEKKNLPATGGNATEAAPAARHNGTDAEARPSD